MRLVFIIFAVIFLIYFYTSPGESTYDYFTRLANSLVTGKLYITEHPSYLNELVPIGDKYYVVYPPMPAIVLTPFVLFFKEISIQTRFSIVLGSINAVLVYLLIKRLNFSKKTALVTTIFFALGTNHWYLTSVGSAWFLAHITAIFFLLLALIETFGKQRLLIIGLILGASFWARTPIIFTILFFYIYFWKKFWPLSLKSLKYFFSFNFGIVMFILLDVLYNYLRFGNFSPFTPYNLIPNISEDFIFKDGFMSLNFIPRHIEALFFQLPKLSSNYPYLIPSLYSTAIWFTSPLLLFVFKAPRNILTIACWAAIIPTLFIIMQWAGVGYAQFGYRFIQDVMPFLLILLASGIGQKVNKWVYMFLILSILVNAWGTILINKFDIHFI